MRQTTQRYGRGRWRAREMLAALFFVLAPAGALAAPWLDLTEPTIPAAALPGGPLFADVPSFFIESILVEGVRRASPQVIVSESLLEPGQIYSEIELRDAVYRVNRLPFILDAHFALRRGSERGKLQLVIAVEETRLLFFGAEASYTRYREPLLLDVLEGPESEVTRSSGLGGLRLFLGNYGVLFAAAGGGDGLQVGYQRYKLFNRRIFLSLGYSRRLCCPVTFYPLGLDPTFSSWKNVDVADRASITLAVPLGGNDVLRFTAAQVDGETGRRHPILDRSRFDDVLTDGFFTTADLRQREVELAWRYDTTDDPVLPTLGRTVTVALDHRTLDSDQTFVQELAADLPSLRTPLPRLHSRLLRLALAGRRHWPLTDRHSLAVHLRLAGGRARVENLALGETTDAGLRLVPGEDLTVWEAEAGVQHSFSLWGREATYRWGELRLESALALSLAATSPDLGPPDDPLAQLSLSLGVVYRNSWGVFRIGVMVVDLGKVV